MRLSRLSSSAFGALFFGGAALWSLPLVAQPVVVDTVPAQPKAGAEGPPASSPAPGQPVAPPAPPTPVAPSEADRLDAAAKASVAGSEKPPAERQAEPAAAPATGDGRPPPDLEGLADDVQGIRTDLENFKFQWQHEIDIHTATTTRNLLLNGVIQTRFSYSDQGTTNATVYKRHTTFDVPLAQVIFTGNLYKDYKDGRNLSYALRFGISQQTSGTNVIGVGSSFLNLLDANISYSVLPTVNLETPVLTITAGQQLLPFGIEVTAPDELKPVILNAQFTTRLGLAYRDIGAIVRGDLFTNIDYGYNYRQAALAYAIGIVNGSGGSVIDNNDNKNVVGRLAFTLPADYNSWLRQLTVGGSVVIGKQNLYTNDATRTLQGKGVQNRYGLDVYYNHWPFGLTYEYVVGKDAVTPGTTAQDPQRHVLTSRSHTGTFFLSFGEQFEAGYRNQGKYDDWWPKTFQPFLRFDSFDPDTATSHNRSDVYTVGLNLFFAETTKFQLNYNHTTNFLYPAQTPPQTNPRVQVNHRQQNAVLAQFQFGF